MLTYRIKYREKELRWHKLISSYHSDSQNQLTIKELPRRTIVDYKNLSNFTLSSLVLNFFSFFLKKSSQCKDWLRTKIIEIKK